jgi:Mg-chelatase subunit ChlD
MTDINRRTRRRYFTAASAVSLSALMHFALIQYLPAIPLGAFGAPENENREVFPPMHVDKVRAFQEMPKYPSIDEYVPSDPNRVADLDEQLGTFKTDTDLAKLEDPVLESEPLAGQNALTAEAKLPELKSNWDPRQEILAIEDRLFHDEVNAAPRRVTPAVPRINQAPDVSAPIEITSSKVLEEAAKIVAAPAWKGPLPSIEKILVAVTEPGNGAGKAADQEKELVDQVNDSASLIDEAREDITSIHAVEGLLGVKVHTFSHASTPDHVYFKIEIYRQGIEALPVLPKEVILIQDCSESMTNAKLNRCKTGLLSWVNSLHDGDKFNIISFRNDVDFCFPASRLVNAISRARARGFIDSLEARGKTDVHGSLEKLLDVEAEVGRPVIAVLVTDGRPTIGLVDSSDIIEQFSHRNKGQVSVFSLGGGSKVNKYLLDLLSHRNRGDSLIVSRDLDLPPALENMSHQLASPVLAGMSYRFSNLDESEVFPKTLSNLYLNRPLVLYGKAPAGNPEVAFQIVGQSGVKPHDMVFSLDLRNASSGDSELRRQWAWHKVYNLISIYTSTRAPAALNAIIQMCDRYGLDVPYAYTLDSPAKP